VAALDRAPHLQRGDQGGGPVSGWQSWTPDDSKDLDHQVWAFRRAEKRERSPAAVAKAEAHQAKQAKAQSTSERKDI
jgi:hypothetical protein